MLETDILIVPADTGFDQFLQDTRGKKAARHLVITKDDWVCGVQTMDAALRHGLEKSASGATLGDVVKTDFAIAHPEDTIFQVLRRMQDRNAEMALVMKGSGVWTGMPRGEDVLGVISKDQVADSVTESIIPYSAG